MRYVLRRLIWGVFIVWGVSLITFFLPYLYEQPISLAIQVLGHGHGIYQWMYAQWLRQHGFDHPIIVRYFNWLWAALHGNLGISYVNSNRFMTVTVAGLVNEAAVRSVWLVTIPTIVSVLIAIPIGLSQAYRRNKLYDHALTTGIFVIYSTPTVLVCLLLQEYVGVDLGWGQPTVTPAALQVSPGNFPSFILHNFSSFLLPFVALIVLSVGGLTRYMRGSALDTLVQDYVRTARAKGAGPVRVLFRHVLRPSVIPLITILGLILPSLIGGALIIEDVFSFPGMGLLAVNATEQSDFATVLAITLYAAVLTVIGNLLADLFVTVADPRIRLGAAR